MATDVTSGACKWPISTVACETCDPLDNLSTEDRALVEAMATDYLWRWSGRKFGACPVTIRPCKQDCTEGASTFYGSGPYTDVGPSTGGWRPVIIDGAWYNLSCGRCGDQCSCTYTPTIELPGPVASIEEVTIDGEVLDPAAYRVDNYRYLIRTDGGDWPSCQNMAASPGDPDTFTITCTRGTPVPAGGQVAAGVLACEFAKALCKDSTCALPQRLQSITRQGVSVAVLDAFDDIDTGHTGIWIIDSWLASVTKPPIRSRVYSVDRPRERNRRTTWTG